MLSERFLKRMIRATIENGADVQTIRRGEYRGSVLLEKYEDVVSVGVFLKTHTYTETNYIDLPLEDFNFKVLSGTIDKLFRMSILGLFLQIEMWEDELPKVVENEDVVEYLCIDTFEYMEALQNRKHYKHSKESLVVNCTYFGDKKVELIIKKRDLKIVGLRLMEV